MAQKYSSMELMVCAASRVLEDNSTLVVGTGAPCAAAMLAQKMGAPGLFILFEAGAIAPILPIMPISVGDSRTMFRALKNGSMYDVMEFCQKGLIDYCFLGGAQIDMYGNLNSTMIGNNIQKPKVRLPGSGGANDLASNSWRTLVITPQDKRRFTNKLDFLTSPGFLTGPGAREAAGLPKGSGPYKVITNLAIMGYDKSTCRMKIESIHEGFTKDDVINNCGFELLMDEKIPTTPSPRDEELRVLREEVDPLKMIIGRG